MNSIITLVNLTFILAELHVPSTEHDLFETCFSKNDKIREDSMNMARYKSDKHSNKCKMKFRNMKNWSLLFICPVFILLVSFLSEDRIKRSGPSSSFHKRTFLVMDKITI